MTPAGRNVALARTVADAVLYEGYLLYPYRSSSRKNQVRWQFGVLGPPGAAEAGVGEEADLAVQCLVRPDAALDGPPAQVDVVLRFLQLQVRSVERAEAGSFVPVDELRVDAVTHLTWDEAVERELALGPYALASISDGLTLPLHVPGGADIEELRDGPGTVVGRLVRRREPLAVVVDVSAVADDGLVRLHVEVRNVGPDPGGDKDAAIRHSCIGTHLLLIATGASFVSLVDPPEDARGAASRCGQRRCWPVLAGPEGTGDVVLASPIILEDHPAVAPESAGALFDSTEIDEILTLRVMTLTDEEKAAARATDAHAAAIIDRCEQMSPEQLQRLHGVLREPHALAGALDAGLDGALDGALDAGPETPFDTGGVPWWDPAVDGSVRPDLESVLVAGRRVTKGSVVRLHPSRRADAQDLFFADRTARVTAVHRDVDGATHVAVVLVDDPAADLHDWYGRYLYFAPDELEPLDDGELSTPAAAHRGEEGTT